MIKILHFADAHIDMANYGRHDPDTGLPLRVLDFLKSLDAIVDAAIDEKVDLVLFAGDAYKDRSPAPTFQREWGRRIMRLSQANIPTLLLVGNHDLSPARDVPTPWIPSIPWRCRMCAWSTSPPSWSGRTGRACPCRCCACRGFLALG